MKINEKEAGDSPFFDDLNSMGISVNFSLQILFVRLCQAGLLSTSSSTGYILASVSAR